MNAVRYCSATCLNGRFAGAATYFIGVERQNPNSIDELGGPELNGRKNEVWRIEQTSLLRSRKYDPSSLKKREDATARQ